MLVIKETKSMSANVINGSLYVFEIDNYFNGLKKNGL